MKLEVGLQFSLITVPAFGLELRAGKVVTLDKYGFAVHVEGTTYRFPHTVHYCMQIVTAMNRPVNAMLSGIGWPGYPTR